MALYPERQASKATGEKRALQRKAEHLRRVLQGVDQVLIDGTERPIQRSADHEPQKEDFSGKKR